MKSLFSEFIFFWNRFWTPRRIVGLSVLVAVFWMAIFFVFNVNIYRDVANCYAWYAREYGRGNWCSSAISGLPPLLIFLGGWLCRFGMEAFHAVILVSAVFYILTVFPLFGLLRMLVPERTVAWGCLLFVLTPKIIRFAGSGILESGRDFFLVSAVFFLFCAWRKNFPLWKYFAFGASLGGLTLARGEGILMAGLLCLCFLIRPWKEYFPLRSGWKNIFFPFVVIVATMLAMISPRLVETYRLTGYPVHDARCVGMLRKVPGVNKIFHAKEVHYEKRAVELPGNKSDADATGPKYTVHGNILALLPGMSRGGYEIYLVFSAIGMLSLILRRRWSKELTFLMFFSLVAAFSFVFVVVAYRYFIFLVPLWMVFTLTGIDEIRMILSRFGLENVFLMILGVIVFVQPWNAVTFLQEPQGFRAQRMASYIRQNRASFLPVGRNKIVMHHCYGSEVVFYCDEDRLSHYGEKIPPLPRTGGFDLLVINAEEKTFCNEILKRKDLEQVEHPYQNDYLLFRPKREK